MSAARALIERAARPGTGADTPVFPAVAKAFHVSPFLPRELEYRMSFA